MSRRILAAVLLAAGCATPVEAPPPAPAEPEPARPTSTEILTVDPSADYPLNFCIVSREDLAGRKAVAIRYGGVEIQFCCGECVGKFRADPKRYLAVLEEALAAADGK